MGRVSSEEGKSLNLFRAKIRNREYKKISRKNMKISRKKIMRKFRKKSENFTKKNYANVSRKKNEKIFTKKLKLCEKKFREKILNFQKQIQHFCETLSKRQNFENTRRIFREKKFSKDL